MVSSGQHVQSNHPAPRTVIIFYLPIASHQRYFYFVLFAQPASQVEWEANEDRVTAEIMWTKATRRYTDEWRVFPSHSFPSMLFVWGIFMRKMSVFTEEGKALVGVHKHNSYNRKKTEQSNNNSPINLLARCVGRMVPQPTPPTVPLCRDKPLSAGKTVIEKLSADSSRDRTTLCLQFPPSQIKWEFTKRSKKNSSEFSPSSRRCAWSRISAARENSASEFVSLSRNFALQTSRSNAMGEQ